MEPTGRGDAELVTAARTGEPEAFGPLAQRWFDRCYDLAWHVLHDRELAADVAQDALLTAWRSLDRLERPEAFGGWLLRITRNRALDVLRREVRSMPTDDATRLEPRADDTVAIGEPVAAFARGQEHDLVWAAAAALGPRDATLLDLHLRHGLEPHELATELGVTPNAAHQALFRLRKRLATAVRAWLLWRDGEPDCVVLRAELLTGGVDRFGPELVRSVERHVTSCEVCEEERERVTAPAALFSAVPIVAAPLALRQVRFERLAESGVPVVVPPAPPTSGGSAGADGPAGRRASGSTWLVAAAVLVVGAVLLGGWTLRAGNGTTMPVDAAAGGAAVVVPPPAPPRELIGILPPDATVADAKLADPLVATDAVENVPDGSGAAVVDAPPDGQESPSGPADPAGPAPAPLGEDPPPTTTPGGTDPSTGAPSADDPPDPSTGPTEEPPPPDPPTGPTEEPPPPDPPTGAPEDEPDEPVAAPTIERLEVAVAGACDDGTLEHEVRWTTTGAESATLQAGRGTSTAVPTSGTTRVCAARGSTFTLSVTGPGGTAARSASAG